MASLNKQLKGAVTRQSNRTTTSNKVNKNRNERKVLCSDIKEEITIYNDNAKKTDKQSYEIFMEVLNNYPAQLNKLFNDKPNEISSLISSKSVRLNITNLNLIINYLCTNDLDLNLDFLKAFLEKITEANNPLNTVAQTSQNKTNNKSAKNNGAPAKNNGAPAKNNGGQTPRKNTTQKNGAPVRPIPAPRKNTAKTQNKTQIISQSKTRN